MSRKQIIRFRVNHFFCGRAEEDEFIEIPKIQSPFNSFSLTYLATKNAHLQTPQFHGTPNHWNKPEIIHFRPRNDLAAQVVKASLFRWVKTSVISMATLAIVVSEFNLSHECENRSSAIGTFSIVFAKVTRSGLRPPTVE